MSYFLVERYLDESIKIVADIQSSHHKQTAVHSYCRQNNIQLFPSRLDITQQYKSSGLCCYQISENRFVILECKYHPSYFFYNEFVEKSDPLGYLEFIYYKPEGLPLVPITASLNC